MTNIYVFFADPITFNVKYYNIYIILIMLKIMNMFKMTRNLQAHFGTCS